MRIQTVEYRRLVTLEGYNNLTLGVTVSVDDGETPLEALRQAEGWVLDQIAKQRGQERAQEELADLGHRITIATQELHDIEQRVEGARRNYYDKVVPFMRKFRSLVSELDNEEYERRHGGEQEAIDDVPFD